jgi:hypothetical protein
VPLLVRFTWQVRPYLTRLYLTEDRTNSQRDHPRVCHIASGGTSMRYLFQLFQQPVSIA